MSSCVRTSETLRGTASTSLQQLACQEELISTVARNGKAKYTAKAVVCLFTTPIHRRTSGRRGTSGVSGWGREAKRDELRGGFSRHFVYFWLGSTGSLFIYFSCVSASLQQRALLFHGIVAERRFLGLDRCVFCCRVHILEFHGVIDSFQRLRGCRTRQVNAT